MEIEKKKKEEIKKKLEKEEQNRKNAQRGFEERMKIAKELEEKEKK
jgi:hypothetical protein